MKTDKTINRELLAPIDTYDSVETIVKNAIRNIIVCLGDDPYREGLKETPDRVYRMYQEVFEGMNYSNHEIANMYDKCFEDTECGDLVTIANIPCFSYCEHHMALIYNMKISVGYIPEGRVIGLSKVARIADMVCKRMQLQERIGSDIADILHEILFTDDIIVVIEAEHSCMTARGIKKQGAVTRTSSLRGQFKSDSDLRNEFYKLIDR